MHPSSKTCRRCDQNRGSMRRTPISIRHVYIPSPNAAVVSADSLWREKGCPPPHSCQGHLMVLVPPPLPFRAEWTIKACFRKALSCLPWRRLEHHPHAAEQSALPSVVIADPAKKAVAPPCSSSPPSMEKAGPGRPTADTLLELGRFELLKNRSVGRAMGLFKACLEESPWHASAKVRWDVCFGGIWCVVEEPVHGWSCPWQPSIWPKKQYLSVPPASA